MIEFMTMRLAAENAINEVFMFNGTVTYAHTQWITREQARGIRVATEYPELLKEASSANISMLEEIEAMEVGSRRLENIDRIDALEWLISSLSDSYIDLTVYARRSDRLNTLGERFELTAEQLMKKQYLLEDLRHKLSGECGTVFEANEELFREVEARVDDPAGAGTGARAHTDLGEFYDDLIA